MERERRPRPSAYLIFLAAFASIVFLTHVGYLRLTFFWDELGYFVPAALDLYKDHLVVPRMTAPNAHPPGIPAYLAAVWSVAGYSAASTRVAMLAVASLVVLASFLLAIRMCRGLTGAPAFSAVALLLVSPLFYTQAMLAQLDMPAMLFTALTLLMFFEGRYRAAALASTALVMTKETGIAVPAALFAWLVFERRFREAAWFLLPFAALGAWLGIIWRHTGSPFGDRSFTDYNLRYPLHAGRFAATLARRFYYLAIADFHWLGTLAIAFAWRYSRIFRTREWRIAAFVAALHILVVSVLGGAALERYLLPVLPLVYIAVASAWSLMPPLRRGVWQAAMISGLAVSLYWNPQFVPAPLENNLAMADFVALHTAAGEFLDRDYPGRAVATAWPLSDALRRPEFGYTTTPFVVTETNTFQPSSLERLNPAKVEVIVLYSRDFEPPYSLLRLEWLSALRARWFGWEPQMTSDDIAARFGLERVARWSRRGQWIEVLARVPARPGLRL